MALFLICACDEFMLEPGYLEGKIAIGPLCPVETYPPSPGCVPTSETYKAYPVIVRTSGGGRKIAQLNPSVEGHYKTELDPGDYTVILDIDDNGISRSNLPLEISVTSGQSTFLDINIDTGIR